LVILTTAAHFAENDKGVRIEALAYSALYRIVASYSPDCSPDTSFTPVPLTEFFPFTNAYPPHTTSRGRVPIKSFNPAHATLHTPTSPLNAATMAQTSGSEMARMMVHLACSRVIVGEVGAVLCDCNGWRVKGQGKLRSWTFFTRTEIRAFRHPIPIPFQLL